MERSEIRHCVIVCERPGFRFAPSGLRLLRLLAANPDIGELGFNQVGNNKV